jgi:hypothetical protein
MQLTLLGRNLKGYHDISFSGLVEHDILQEIAVKITDEWLCLASNIDSI